LIKKSKFSKLETNFLGYVVSHNVIKTDPEKISTIVKYPIPKNIPVLRSFLGLTGCYRKFVQNYAKIAKPLTKYLEGQNGKVSKKASRKTLIQFDDSSVRAFNELKENLIAQVELVQPDYNKKCTLTTDASDLAIGPVFSQEGKPITFISKTLTKTDQISISQKNPNIEMKGWYSFIESYSPQIIYRPGATDVVADALSRIQISN